MQAISFSDLIEDFNNKPVSMGHKKLDEPLKILDFKKISEADRSIILKQIWILELFYGVSNFT